MRGVEGAVMKQVIVIFYTNSRVVSETFSGVMYNLRGKGIGADRQSGQRELLVGEQRHLVRKLQTRT